MHSSLLASVILVSSSCVLGVDGWGWNNNYFNQNKPPANNYYNQNKPKTVTIVDYVTRTQLKTVTYCPPSVTMMPLVVPPPPANPPPPPANPPSPPPNPPSLPANPPSPPPNPPSPPANPPPPPTTSPPAGPKCGSGENYVAGWCPEGDKCVMWYAGGCEGYGCSPPAYECQPIQNPPGVTGPRCGTGGHPTVMGWCPAGKTCVDNTFLPGGRCFGEDPSRGWCQMKVWECR